MDDRDPKAREEEPGSVLLFDQEPKNDVDNSQRGEKGEEIGQNINDIPGLEKLGERIQDVQEEHERTQGKKKNGKELLAFYEIVQIHS